MEDNKEFKDQDVPKDGKKDQGKQDRKDSRQGGNHHNPRKGDKDHKSSKEGLKYSKNDYRFYAATEQIAKDIASVPFNYVGGTVPQLNVVQTNINTSASETWQGVVAPSVARIRYIPSIGITSSKTDSINMAATQLYVYVRHENSGARNFESPDMMMTELAVEDIMGELMEISRIIRTAGFYKLMNHSVPDMLLAAMNVDADDLRLNLAQYRARLNLLIEKANSFALPSYFKSLLRRAFVASNIFMDSNSERGQFYIYVRDGYYTWSPTTSTKGSSLVYTQHSTIPEVLSNRLDIVDKQLDALFLDADPNIIFGDILKAFNKPGQLFALQQVPEEAVIQPLFDEDALAQIENMVMFQEVLYSNVTSSVYSNLDVTQENQLIKWNPILTTISSSASSRNIYNFGGYIFNSHKDHPDYKDVLEWSRLITTSTATAEPEGTSGAKITRTCTSCGLELPIAYEVYFNNSITGEPSIATINQVISGNQTTSNQAYLTMMNFDWHPFIYQLANPVRYGGDLKVNGIINGNTVNDINKSAVYACYYSNSLYNSDKSK